MSAGATITFRLKIKEIGSEFSSYSDTNIIVNQPPHGGSLEVNPSLGYSFSTTFIMIMAQYSDDTSDYPLSYSFSYQLSPSSNVLNIQLKCGLNSVRNILPAGYYFMDSQIIIIGIVYDILGSSNTDIVKVTVKETLNFDYYSYLSKTLSNSLDVKQSLSMVNMVASSISKVNCSSVSRDYCETLHRYPCQNTPQQCSSCKDGYIGIIGDSNIKCLDFSSGVVTGRVGDSCSSNSDCLFNSCISNKCVDTNKTCPTSITNEVCSGHGKCIYTDSSSSVVTSCTEADVTCSASCICNDNYYGDVDCSLDPTALKQADDMILLMCKTLNNYIEKSSISPSLIDSAVNSAYVIYSPGKVISKETDINCKIYCLQVHMLYIDFNANC